MRGRMRVVVRYDRGLASLEGRVYQSCGSSKRFGGK